MRRALERVAILAPALVLALVLALVVTLGSACKRESADRPEGAAATTPPPTRPLPPEEAPFAPDTPVPDGPAVAASLLRETPSEGECEAACERILTAETRPWHDGTPEEAREDVLTLLAAARVSQRPACVRRCRAEFSRAVTECLQRTDDVAAAVDCLARTGAVGSH